MKQICRRQTFVFAMWQKSTIFRVPIFWQGAIRAKDILKAVLVTQIEKLTSYTRTSVVP